MRRFLRSVLIFSLPALVAYVVFTLYILPGLIEKTEGPSTATQIKKSFHNALARDYDLLIVGNSEPYRGINPDMLEIPSYNFAHDADSYNQIYHKLMYLDRNHKRIKYLILCASYFQFNYKQDRRNYINGDLLGPDYLADYGGRDFFGDFLRKTNITHFGRVKYIANIFKPTLHNQYQKDNGQYIVPGHANADDSRIYEQKRIPLQEEYFGKIIQYCKQNNIRVFITQFPVRKNVLSTYTDEYISDFNKLLDTHVQENVHRLDYSHQPGWTLDDYNDITHLSVTGADKFSRQLNDTIKQINSHNFVNR